MKSIRDKIMNRLMRNRLYGQLYCKKIHPPPLNILYDRIGRIQVIQRNKIEENKHQVQ
jgi:hypothetical protein